MWSLIEQTGSSTTVKPGYANKANRAAAVLPVAGAIVREENNAMRGKGASFVQHGDACHVGDEGAIAIAIACWSGPISPSSQIRVAPSASHHISQCRLC